MQAHTLSRSGYSPLLADADARGSAMARLMAVAGHDLQQPLHVALSSIARAMSEGPNPGGSGHLLVATTALRRLGSELEDLARCSQAGEGLAPTIRRFPVERLLREAEADWRSYAEVCGVELRIVGSRAWVASDPGMLKTILRNLVVNAVKYSGRGGRVLVGCRLRRDQVTIAVHDDGCGIPAARLADIFEAFLRLDHRGAVPGFGLGLHIVRQTAQMLGAPVAVRSVEGSGSTFQVSLPRVPAKPDA